MVMSTILKIKNFCNHPNYIAEIYGEGPLERELSEYIRAKGIEGAVFLRGFSKDVILEIASATMFVRSSDYGGMSNALIETVGMSFPCISTDHPIGGARTTIQDGVSGFLVPVGMDTLWQKKWQNFRTTRNWQVVFQSREHYFGKHYRFRKLRTAGLNTSKEYGKGNEI